MFDVFDLSKHGGTRRAKITIQRSGNLFINGAAHTLMRKPEKVLLMYDKELKRIGFKPDDSEKAFVLHGGDSRTGRRTVSIRSFLSYYAIPYEETKSYTPKEAESGEYTYIDLNQPILSKGDKET